MQRRSHHDDDKVQPAPGIGEVLDDAHGQPLHRHLHGEDDGEDLVHVIKDVLKDRPLSQVDVLRRLKKTQVTSVLCPIGLKEEHFHIVYENANKNHFSVYSRFLNYEKAWKTSLITL
jgi:hypothetical protein